VYNNQFHHQNQDKTYVPKARNSVCKSQDRKTKIVEELTFRQSNIANLEETIKFLARLSPLPTGIFCIETNKILWSNQSLNSLLEVNFNQDISKINPALFFKYNLWQQLITELQNQENIDNFILNFKQDNGEQRKAIISGRIINYEGAVAALLVFTNIKNILDTEDEQQQEIPKQTEPTPCTLATNGSSVPLYLMERALVATSNGIILTDATHPDNPIIYVNPAFEAITGYCASEVVGRNCRFLQGNQTDQLEVQKLRFALQQKKEYHAILKNYRKDGTVFWNKLYIAPVFAPGGQLTHFIGVQNDVTQHIQALDTLQKQEQQYRKIVETATEGIWLINQDNETTFVNQQMATMLGYKVEEMLGATLFSFMDAEGVVISHKNLSRRQQGIQEKYDFKFRCKDGSDLWVIISGTPLFDEQGKYVGVLKMVTNISDRKQAEDSLRESKQRLDGILNALEDVVWSISADTFETLYLNPTVLQIYGRSASEFLDNPKLWFEVIHPDDQQWVSEAIEPLLLNGSAEIEYRIVRPDGQICWLYNRSHVIYDAVGKPVRIEGIATDITERKSMEEKLAYYAFYDDLTGLPNRVSFMEKLAQAITKIKQNPQQLFAVLFLDLDRFKIVNDSLGHVIGDQLLLSFAQRLQSCLQPEDIVARLGGDEFAILISGIKSTDEVTCIAQKIHQELKSPFNLNGYEVFTTASIGIALGSSKYIQAADLLRDADTALYRAKEQGKSGHMVFDPTMYDQAVALLQLETDLRWAISRQELEVVYQPIVSIKTGKITGFEALVRWQHPQKGYISPAEFIPVAEETGLIIPIGEFVLRESCQKLRQWHTEFPQLQHLQMNVNLSGKQLSQGCLVEQIQEVLQEVELHPSNLKLEITESAIMSSPEQVAIIFKQLRSLGIQLCIDDFGTGYSSLAYLHYFPIDVLKIDRSFINRIDTEHEQLAIVRAIVTLAHNLGIDVVAEGVETISQLMQLRLLQSDQAQGYLFSKALPSDEIPPLLASMLYS
jgi:diguanylate cyclase (GGDEF)-like protein/PAS domain S-box-containing protein